MTTPIILYEVGWFDEDAESGDCREFFASLAAARKKEAFLRRNPEVEDVEIERIVLVDLPPRKLLIAALNRTYFVASRETVS